MNYYQRNKEKILKRAYEKYHNGGRKEKAQEYYKKKIKKKLKKQKEKNIEIWINLEKKIKKSLDRYYRLKKEKDNYKDE